jgi:hypothetical protein
VPAARADGAVRQGGAPGRARPAVRVAGRRRSRARGLGRGEGQQTRGRAGRGCACHVADRAPCSAGHPVAPHQRAFRT